MFSTFTSQVASVLDECIDTSDETQAPAADKLEPTLPVVGSSTASPMVAAGAGTTTLFSSTDTTPISAEPSPPNEGPVSSGAPADSAAVGLPDWFAVGSRLRAPREAIPPSDGPPPERLVSLIMEKDRELDQLRAQLVTSRAASVGREPESHGFSTEVAAHLARSESELNSAIASLAESNAEVMRLTEQLRLSAATQDTLQRRVFEADNALESTRQTVDELQENVSRLTRELAASAAEAAAAAAPPADAGVLQTLRAELAAKTAALNSAVIELSSMRDLRSQPSTPAPLDGSAHRSAASAHRSAASAAGDEASAGPPFAGTVEFGRVLTALRRFALRAADSSASAQRVLRPSVQLVRSKLPASLQGRVFMALVIGVVLFWATFSFFVTDEERPLPAL